MVLLGFVWKSVSSCWESVSRNYQFGSALRKGRVRRERKYKAFFLRRIESISAGHDIDLRLSSRTGSRDVNFRSQGRYECLTRHYSIQSMQLL